MKEAQDVKATVKLTVEERLHADIVFGTYRPEEWLKLVEVQERYGASQGEVRKALANLCQHGYLEHRKNFGYRIPPVDRVKMRQLRQARTLLETGAASLMMGHVTAEDIADLRAHAERFDQSIYSDGRQAQSRSNFEFHRRFYEVCRNPFLEDTIREWRERTASSSDKWMTLQGMLESSREHHDIVDALEQRDLQRLQMLIAQHVEGNERKTAHAESASAITRN